MTTAAFAESVVEQAALAWLESMGYLVLSGPEIAPGESAAERTDYGQVMLERRGRRMAAKGVPSARTACENTANVQH